MIIIVISVNTCRKKILF